MNSQLEGIPKKMLKLGLSALSHANRHAAYFDSESPNWDQLSVLQAAHAAEIIIKARITQEHPLLIFEKFPKITSTDISLQQLFSDGKTVEWSDLPNRLWATTGISLKNLECFKEFGKLRNSIQHFGAVPDNISLGSSSLKFIFKVVDPFINDNWGLFAIDFDEDYDSKEHFPPILLNKEIEFLISPSILEYQEHWDVEWDSLDETYRNKMKRRIENA